MMRLSEIFALALALLLAACAGDFVTDPTRPRPTRAVESPNGISNPNSEILGGPMGTVSFVTVDLPNHKNEQPVVHTIAEPLAALTTRPATQPAAPAATAPVERPAAPAKDEIKVVAQQRAGDAFWIARDNEANADVWVLCPMGIGTVTLERTGEEWPAVIRVHLRYDQDRGFTHVEGFTASELTAAGGEGAGKVALKAAVDKENGLATISIPGFARGQRILIEWVDMYR